MKRLILTTSDSGAGNLKRAGIADIVVSFGFVFVRGPLPSDAELAEPFAHAAIDDWLLNIYRTHFGKVDRSKIGLIDLCERCETIELWIDPVPNAQLTLIWLLDHLRPHEGVAAKLMLVQPDLVIGQHAPKQLAEGRLPAVKILSDDLETAGAAWRAYRAPTPQAWFDLLEKDLSRLPQLRQSVLELLEELPMPTTGLGATEMLMLELISAGHTGPFDVFPGEGKPNTRRVFAYWEVGSLLDGLAHCPAPAVSGLDEGPFTLAMHEDSRRHERYKGSRLSLTPLGEAVVARTEDFSRHNPSHRWWGGTELTNDNLWRWDPVHRQLIAP